jgi:hypothetical protein
MLLGCLPGSSGTLRRAFFCLSLLVCGYVARCAVDRSLGGGGGGARLPRWPPPGEWAAAFANHAHSAAGVREGAKLAHQ